MKSDDVSQYLGVVLLLQVTDGPDSVLKHQLMDEAVDRQLQELMDWCMMTSSTTKSTAGSSEAAGSSSAAVGSNNSHTMSNTATSSTIGHSDGSEHLRISTAQMWRLSFAPFALYGLACGIGMDPGLVSTKIKRSMEMTDLGLRLESAVEYGKEMRACLQARLALGSI